MHYHERVSGFIPESLRSPKLILSLPKDEVLPNITWLYRNYYFDEEFHTALRNLPNAKDSQTIFIAVSTLLRSNSAAELYFFKSHHR